MTRGWPNPRGGTWIWGRPAVAEDAAEAAALPRARGRGPGCAVRPPQRTVPRDFEDLVAWLVTRTDKSSVSAFARVAWRTVGAVRDRLPGSSMLAVRSV